MLIENLDVAVILAPRQNLIGEQTKAANGVAGGIVAVGSLSAVHVPVGRGIARADDLQHLRQRGADHRSPRFLAIKELLLVNLLRLMRMPDEDEIDTFVFPSEEEVQEDKEALSEVLLAFAHRAGNVHQTEHHGFGARYGLRLETVIAQVDWIDISDRALTRFQ